MIANDLPFCDITEFQAFIFQVNDQIVSISSFSHCALTGLQQKPLITGLWSAGGPRFCNWPLILYRHYDRNDKLLPKNFEAVLYFNQLKYDLMCQLNYFLFKNGKISTCVKVLCFTILISAYFEGKNGS